MSVCGCTSSPLFKVLDFAEHCAEKIGDGVVRAAFDGVEGGLALADRAQDAAERGEALVERVGERVFDNATRAAQWAGHVGAPLVDVGCAVSGKVAQLGEHLRHTVDDEYRHLDPRVGRALHDALACIETIEARRQANNERAVEAIVWGATELLEAAASEGTTDGSPCSDASYHVDPQTGQFTQDGDPYGL